MTELTERYVLATLRTLPERKRADIEAELRASIADAVEARVGSGEPPAIAEKDVLTGLGDPDRLAASYAGRPGHLIGPDLFFDYKRLVTVLLITVTPIVIAVTAAAQAIAGADIGSIFAEALGVGFSLIVHICFWTTLVFYLIERSGETTTTEWSLSNLPAVPGAGMIKLSETIASVVFLVFAIAMLLVSRTASPLTTADGVAIPIFAGSMWDFWFPFLISVLGAEILFELIKYRVGRWTWGLASINLALNALFVVPAVYLLASDRVFNPEFLAEIPSAALAADWVIPVLVVVAGVADIIQGYRKAYIAR